VAVIDLAVRHETRGVESVALVSSWGIPSVVYTMHGSAIIRDEALRAGALGFVSKSAAGGELVTAVLEAAAGRTYEAGVEYLPGGEELTDLERRVLHEIPSGATSKEIALRVGLAGGTVDNVISSIIAKLDLKGKKRSALASWAVEHGLGPSES
jgi:DNA-binding NarL/FixJ family response regulator